MSGQSLYYSDPQPSSDQIIKNSHENFFALKVH